MHTYLVEALIVVSSTLWVVLLLWKPQKE